MKSIYDLNIKNQFPSFLKKYKTLSLLLKQRAHAHSFKNVCVKNSNIILIFLKYEMLSILLKQIFLENLFKTLIEEFKKLLYNSPYEQPCCVFMQCFREFLCN